MKIGKAAGFDSVSIEFFRFGNFIRLASALRNILHFFNGMLSRGVIQTKFNTSLLIPIPKKGELASPGDYRLISISASTATLFELLFLDKIPYIKNSNRTQFG